MQLFPSFSILDVVCLSPSLSCLEHVKKKHDAKHLRAHSAGKETASFRGHERTAKKERERIRRPKTIAHTDIVLLSSVRADERDISSFVRFVPGDNIRIVHRFLSFSIAESFLASQYRRIAIQTLPPARLDVDFLSRRRFFDHVRLSNSRLSP